MRGGDLGYSRYFRIAYELLPPPLSALPAKYHTPVSLLVHSLSTGAFSAELSRRLEIDEHVDLLFLMGFVHDFSQKLVSDGISTIKRTKEYVREKLDILGFESSIVKKVLKSIELNTAETGVVPDGVDPRVAVILRVADMMQGRLSLFELLRFIQQEVSKIDPSINTMIYGVYLPQVGVRTRIMEKVIEKLGDAIVLVSPEGVLAISDEELGPVHLDWDELRVDDTSVLPYQAILRAEEELNPAIFSHSSKGSSRKDSKDKRAPSQKELREKRWSTFGKIFYRNIPDREKTPPKLPAGSRNFLLNIVLDNVEYVESGDMICGLCGIPHSKEHSFFIAMYRKILGAPWLIIEKWNRMFMSSTVVRGERQWKRNIGLCPFCCLDAIVMRELEVYSKGYLIATVAKPVLHRIFTIISHLIQRVMNKRFKVGIMEMKEKMGTLIAGASAETVPDGLLLDYSSASIIKPVYIEEEKSIVLDVLLENLPTIARLLSMGIYPLKLLTGIDTTVTDRVLTTNYMFPAYDYPITSVKYEILYTIAELYLAGIHGEKRVLQLDYSLAPLATIYLDPSLHSYIMELLESIRG